MTALLQSGFKNNINAITIRASASSQIYTDRSIDIDGDGDEETVVSVGVPTGVGDKVQQTVTVNAGAARTIIDGSGAESVNLPDGDTYYTLSTP